MVIVLLLMTVISVCLAIALWTALRVHEQHAEIATFFLMFATALLWVLYIDVYTAFFSTSQIFSVGQARALIFRSIIDGAMGFLLWRMSPARR